ncbi:MAG: S46 family peptidase [Acidobacteriota bacterium]|jgi:hypothetical protein
MRKCLISWLIAIVAGAAAVPVVADEGMWTLDNPPTAQLKAKYDFTPSPQWLERLRLAAVRFNDGGSGSFVSPRGLVLTNHHVARGQLQKLSSKDRDLVAAGFLATRPDEEIPCPDLELNVLVSMEDVTSRVTAAVKPDMAEKEAMEARKAAIAAIEKESLAATGLRSDVVTLYAGGEYWLYRYKKYTDVRLVFAPEEQIAFFGGDPDNFTYPRWNLDMTLFRVWENGQPITSPAYLKWNPAGAGDGELVFVVGHPGSTNRLHTLAQLEAQRDVVYPDTLAMMKRMLAVCEAYATRGPEQQRQALGVIFGLQNGIKARTGELEGLKNPAILGKKAAEEADFRRRVESNPVWQKQFGSAWEDIAAAQAKALTRRPELIHARLGGRSLPRLAQTIVRYVVEVGKPDADRLEEFRDSQLESLRFRMFSPAPVYPELEELLLADALRQSLEALGAEHPFVKAALTGKSAEEVAREAVRGTALADPAFRRQLVEGGSAAVEASTDPLIALARRVDPYLRELRRWQEDHIDSVQQAAGEKLAKARFAVYGKSLPPDATFTLRLSYGTVKGYPYNGTQAPPWTTLYGLYDRAASFSFRPPFHLPSRWANPPQGVNLATRVNFVTTHDIIGGNSGSPVVNRAGELVGLIFDGNIESLVGRFVYDDTANRAVSVHTAFMTEALARVYGAEALVRELLGER